MLDLADRSAIPHECPYELPTADAALLTHANSALDANASVLALAGDDRRPILDRVKSLALASDNLDEFFQVQLARIRQQVSAARPDATGPQGDSCRQSTAVQARVRQQVSELARIFEDGVRPRLGSVGIAVVDWCDLSASEKATLDTVFGVSVYPVLTPLAAGSARLLSCVSNLSLNLAVLVQSPNGESARFACVKIPPSLPRFLVLPTGNGRRIPVEQVVGAHLGRLFAGMTIMAHHPFRVTRIADLEARSPSTLETSTISTASRAARLEVAAMMPEDLRPILLRKFGIADRDLYAIDGLLDLTCLRSLTRCTAS